MWETVKKVDMFILISLLFSRKTGNLFYKGLTKRALCPSDVFDIFFLIIYFLTFGVFNVIKWM